MPITEYPDGISRLDAYRRLLATTEPPTRIWSVGLWITRLKALAAVLWALRRERRLPAASVAHAAATHVAITLRDRSTQAVLARGVVVGRLRGQSWWADGPLTVRVQQSGVLGESIGTEWMGLPVTCGLPQGVAGLVVRRGDRVTLVWPAAVFSCVDAVEARA